MTSSKEALRNAATCSSESGFTWVLIILGSFAFRQGFFLIYSFSTACESAALRIICTFFTLFGARAFPLSSGRLIVSPTNREQLDELVEIIVEIELNRNPITRIGKDAEYPSDYVRQRMRKLTSEHIRKVLDGISENQTQVHNTKAYLLASLFNVTATMDNYYTMQVNHDKNRLS